MGDLFDVMHQMYTKQPPNGHQKWAEKN